MIRKVRKTSALWNVLIAEDDSKAQETLLKTLRKVGHCVSVGNGSDALLAYQKAIKKKLPFDFILLDVTMPVLGGFDVLKAIRSEEEKNNVTAAKPARIIMITAYKDSLMEIYNMGWDEYITKPIDPKMLLSKMKQLTKK